MSIRVRPLQEADIPRARHILALAFSHGSGSDDAQDKWSQMDFVGTRWRADPAASFAVEIDGELAGSNFASRWGSVGLVGPLTIHPEYWDRGLGSQLMVPVMDCFDRWQVDHAGLFTFANSPKHMGLYQKFGFWPRFLNAIMMKRVGVTNARGDDEDFFRFSLADRQETLADCRALTVAVYPGLDLEREITAVVDQGLGETILIREEGQLRGFAVCHCGPGTEAGSDRCYVKFGVVQGDGNSHAWLTRLLRACEVLAAESGLTELNAGISTARREAYAGMLSYGFRTTFQGVAMHRPGEPGYSRPGAFVVDDWR